jgi:hypothetical protein
VPHRQDMVARESPMLGRKDVHACFFELRLGGTAPAAPGGGPVRMMVGISRPERFVQVSGRPVPASTAYRDRQVLLQPREFWGLQLDTNEWVQGPGNSGGAGRRWPSEGQRPGQHTPQERHRHSCRRRHY